MQFYYTLRGPRSVNRPTLSQGEARNRPELSKVLRTIRIIVIEIA